MFGLWRATWGMARGVFWDLPKLAVKSLFALPNFALNEMYYMTELWYALKDHPGAQKQFFNEVVAKVEAAYNEAPALLAKIKNLPETVKTAVNASLDKFSKELNSGDWEAALTELSASTTDAIAQIALTVGPGILARSAKAAALVDAAKTAEFGAETEKLEGALKAIEPAAEALGELSKTVTPGLWFTTEHLQKLFGITAKEAEWLAKFTAENKISVVLRSRAAESIEWINNKGALLKPYWIKAKNVNWADVEYFGFNEERRRPCRAAQATPVR